MCLDPCGMYPCGGDPTHDVPAELVCTHLTQAVTLCTKERIQFGAQSQLLMGLPACAQHHCISALMGTFSHLEKGPSSPLLRLWQTAQSPRKCLLESTEDELGFWLTSWYQSSTNGPWHTGRPSFPFHSCLETQEGRFL